MTWRDRYRDAHAAWHAIKYPAANASFGSPPPIWPEVRKSNGLTRMILNFLLWSGHRATRITTAGRMIGKPGKQYYIPGTTRRGTADISATINGRSVMLEIKCGDDVASEYQLREQELERKAGGVYEFVHNPDEFFLFYDLIISMTMPDNTLS